MNRRLSISLYDVLFYGIDVLFYGIVVWIILASFSSSWAGQVITNEDRAWAKSVLAGEKGLGAPGASNTLAVLSFRNTTGKQELDPLQKGLALMLITDLSQVESIQVVERVKLQALVDEMELGKSGLVDMDQAPRIGKLLGAQHLIGGDLQNGQTHAMQIKALFLDVPTAEILKQKIAEGDLAGLFDLEKELVSDILTFLMVELTPEEEKRIQRPLTTSIKAAMAFFQGIAASDSGDYRKAARFYKQALKTDPGISRARESLLELQDLGLVPRAKSSDSFLRSIKDQTSLTDQLTPEDVIKRAERAGVRSSGNGPGQTNPVEFPPVEFP
ncbi:MAG: CsgG/HfaB family protein [bacterium]